MISSSKATMIHKERDGISRKSRRIKEASLHIHKEGQVCMIRDERQGKQRWQSHIYRFLDHS